MDNGVFQTCFPMNCILQTSVGTYETGNGVLAASALKDMQTEWYPDAEGTAVVSYQLVTYKQNPLTQKWTINEYGPTLTLNFSYGVSGVSVTFADQSAQSAPYYDLTGRRVLVPSNGIYVRNGRKVVVK